MAPSTSSGEGASQRRTRRSFKHENSVVAGSKPGRVTNQLLYLQEKVMKGLRVHPDAWPFLKPVDPIKLNIPDYDLVVKHPMDLGTIKMRLEEKFYHTGMQCVDDFNKVFNNCYNYNKPDQEVYLMAKALENRFHSLLNEMPEVEIEVNVLDKGEGKESRPVKEFGSSSKSVRVLVQPSKSGTRGESGKKLQEPRAKKLKVETVVNVTVSQISTAEAKPMSYTEKMRLYENIKKLESDGLEGVVEMIRPMPPSPIDSVPYKEFIVNLEDISASKLFEVKQYVEKRMAEKSKKPLYQVIKPMAETKAELLEERELLEKKLNEVVAKIRKLNEN